MKTLIVLEPLDVLFFRDARPFDAGQHNVARSRYPLPSVVRGCLRAALLQSFGADFNDRRGAHFGVTHPGAQRELGGPRALGEMRVVGPFPAKLREQDAQLFLPRPLDLAAQHEDGRWTLQRLAPLRLGAAALLGPRLMDRHTTSGADDLALMSPSKPSKLTAPQWISPRLVQRYLSGKELDARAEDLLYAPGTGAGAQSACAYEGRVGIQREHGPRTVAEGMFYKLNYLRFERGWGLGVEVELHDPDVQQRLIDLHGSALLLGGKRRRALLHVMPSGVDGLPSPQPGKGDPKLWLLTPTPRAALESLRHRWRGGVTDRFEPLGGWDIARGAPKPARAALPPGSVLCLEGAQAPSLNLSPDDAVHGLGAHLTTPWRT
ncbi:MAG: hypothetical protein H6741_26725 [Alphaproteobacteria bacterium]|nr:hypothetical protein [Alphaproteobacteria bacterium]